MSGFKTVKDQIVATLQTVSSVQAVYGHEAKMLNDGGYPAATVSGNGHEETYHSVGSHGTNNTVYRHFVRLYFRTNEQNDADYEDVLETVVDNVMTALRQNITLNGTCQFSIPESGQFMDGQKEDPVRVYQLIVSSTVLQAR